MDIPGYTLCQALGRGEMAVVYLANQTSLQRQVALKIMRPDRLHTPALRQRFLAEAAVASRLSHPHIAKIYDVGPSEHYHFLAMEYLPGGTLERKLRCGISLVEGLKIVVTLASALDYAHYTGVVHGGLSANNILFRDDATPVISDFRLAKLLLETPGGDGDITLIDEPLTAPPTANPDERHADFYALGNVCYEMITGYAPQVAPQQQGQRWPIPQLPPVFAPLQPVINALMRPPLANHSERAEEIATLVQQGLAGLDPQLLEPPLVESEEAKPAEERRAELVVKEASSGDGYPPLPLARGAAAKSPSVDLFTAAVDAVAPAEHTLTAAARGRSRRPLRWLGVVGMMVLMAGLGWTMMNLLLNDWSAPEPSAPLAAKGSPPAPLAADDQTPSAAGEQRVSALLQRVSALRQRGDFGGALRAVEQALVLAPELDELQLLQESFKRLIAQEQALNNPALGAIAADFSAPLLPLERTSGGGEEALAALAGDTEALAGGFESQERVILLARRAMAVGRYQESIALIDQGLTQWPRSLKLLQWRGRVLDDWYRALDDSEEL